jgi:hypothetical protein
MKTFLLRLEYWQRGFAAGVVIFLVLFLSDLFQLKESYSGTCGDVLTKSAKTYACSLRDYMLNDPFFGLCRGVNARLTWGVYLAVILASVLIGALLGFFRRSR